MWNSDVWNVPHWKVLHFISSPIEVCVTSRGGLTAHALCTQLEGALKQRGYEQCNIWPWNTFRSHTFLKELFLLRPCIGTYIEMLQFNFMKIRIRASKSMRFHLCNIENEKLILNCYTKVPLPQNIIAHWNISAVANSDRPHSQKSYLHSAIS